MVMMMKGKGKSNLTVYSWQTALSTVALIFELSITALIYSIFYD
jgi:hypothetical protein